MKSAILLFLGALSSVSSQLICGCPPGDTVCASNYVTYPSVCEMQCGDIHNTRHVLYYGPCREDAPLNRLCGCRPIGPAVCANDGKTYRNECEMRCGDYSKTRYVVHIGPCQPVTFYKK